MLKRTKIVCTIGPASERVAVIQKMIAAGMNSARLNFSHADLAYHKKLIRNVRRAALRERALVPIIADLQGPKIRLGNLPQEGVFLKKNEIVVLGQSPVRGMHAFPVTYKGLYRDVRAGERILIDDGSLELVVLRVRGKGIYAKVRSGGKVTSHKGINVPDSEVQLGSLTTKDRHDVRFALRENVEWIALSFVRRKEDVDALRVLLRGKPQKIIAKIEKPEALQNIVEIIDAADAIMVARGDLGVEVPEERVPVAQKNIIAQCLAAGKPVVVATQMLDSMMRAPHPTRAEVSDVANAVIDHADAVMLSGETANGNYPAQAVSVMNRIIRETEASKYDDVALGAVRHGNKFFVAQADSALHFASVMRAQGIYVSGENKFLFARSLANLRQEYPIFVEERNKFVAAQMQLQWGTTALRNARELKRFLSRGARYLSVRMRSRNGYAAIHQEVVKN